MTVSPAAEGKAMAARMANVTQPQLKKGYIALM